MSLGELHLANVSQFHLEPNRVLSCRVNRYLAPLHVENYVAQSQSLQPLPVSRLLPVPRRRQQRSYPRFKVAHNKVDQRLTDETYNYLQLSRVHTQLTYPRFSDSSEEKIRPASTELASSFNTLDTGLLYAYLCMDMCSVFTGFFVFL